jgi:hypothetical protein
LTELRARYFVATADGVDRTYVVDDAGPTRATRLATSAHRRRRRRTIGSIGSVERLLAWIDQASEEPVTCGSRSSTRMS